MEGGVLRSRGCCRCTGARQHTASVPYLHSIRRASHTSSISSQSRHNLIDGLFLHINATRAPTQCSVSCNATDNRTNIGGYTPSDYITFSDDPAAKCTHRAEVLVEAPVDVCFGIWMDWSQLVDFLDLIGQIGLDKDTTNMALFQCFYRFQQLPVMEICFLLERVEVVDNKSIKFESQWGMPLMGEVTFAPAEDGRTRVAMYFSHPLPVLLVQLSIGTFSVETDMAPVLQDNMAEFRQIAEAAAPSDWPTLKQQAAQEAARAATEAAEAARAAAAAAAAATATAPRAQADQQGAQQQTKPQDQAASGSGRGATVPTATAIAEAGSAPSTTTSNAAGSGRRRSTTAKAATSVEPADAGAVPPAAPKRSRRTSSRARTEEASTPSSSSSASTSRRPSSRRGTATTPPTEDATSAAAPASGRKTRARTSRSTASSSAQTAGPGKTPQQPAVVNGVRSAAAGQATAMPVGAGRRPTGSSAPL